MDVHPSKNGINRYWSIPKSLDSSFPPFIVHSSSISGARWEVHPFRPPRQRRIQRRRHQSWDPRGTGDLTKPKRVDKSGGYIHTYIYNVHIYIYNVYIYYGWHIYYGWPYIYMFNILWKLTWFCDCVLSDLVLSVHYSSGIPPDWVLPIVVMNLWKP